MASNNRFQSIVVLTGAGISAESGIRTFRGGDGLWEEHRIEDVATPEGYHRDPALVHRFYNQRRQHLLNNGIEPNAGHLALGEFEHKFSGAFTLVTQNIDNLHEQGGSRNLLHMHGELLKMRCERSGKIFPWTTDCYPDTVCECCRQPGLLRPDVVWFGEMPYHMDAIYHALGQCDLFIAIGTSGNVYPAAGFFEIAGQSGAHTVELNLEPSPSGSRFSEQHYGPASEVVPEYLDQLLD